MDEPTGDTSTENQNEESYDIAAASQRIAAQMGDEFRVRDEPETHEVVKEEAPVTPSPETTTPPPAPVAYEVPKSWKREMHEHWGKVTPEAQAYIIEREKQLLDGFSSIRPIQDALKPHMEYLNSRNVPVHQAIDTLLRAQQRLTMGTPDERLRWYQKLGEDLKITAPAPRAQAEGSQANDLTPDVQTIKQELDAIRSTIEEERQAKIEERQAKINEIRTANQKTVEEFASDTKAHPYFDEVADEMTILIKSGFSLQEAYDRSVRMNPVTFEKEKARLLTEHEAKLKENARLASLPKKKAASVNLKSDRDGRGPTEPVGTMEDTIAKAHKAILARA